MKTRALILILAAAALTACGSDHAHDPSGGHPGDDDAESWAVTAWGEHFELFPEIDALQTGETAGAHVHVTILDGFLPATEGSVTIVLVGPDGTEERFGSTTAIRPGIFNVEISPATPGERDLLFEITTGGVSETIPGGRVLVGEAGNPGGLVEEAHTLPAVDGGEEVSFLKEQQWRTAFDTEWALTGSLRPSVLGTARVEPPSGGEVVLTAPVTGVVRADAWPHTGQRVSAGDGLISLIPTTGNTRSLADFKATVREFEARYDAATARMQRLEALLEKEAVSQREVEAARAEAIGIEARFEAARTELESAEAGRMGREGVAGLQIRAPFTGRVAEVLVSPGEQVASGASLLRIIRERPVWIRVALTPDAVATLDGEIGGMLLDTGASTEPMMIPDSELRLVAVAPEIDPRTGTVEVLLEIGRTVDELKPGLRATAQILLEGEIEGLVLPRGAVVDDAGVPVVYVQLDGESFSRREVQVRQRQGNLVLVEGVLPGERVVTLGGAAIRRASLLASGTVEGHVH